MPPTIEEVVKKAEDADAADAAAMRPLDGPAGQTVIFHSTAPACGNCRFWLPPLRASHGACRESPATILKLAAEWCGRHQPKEE